MYHGGTCQITFSDNDFIIYLNVTIEICFIHAMSIFSLYPTLHAKRNLPLLCLESSIECYIFTGSYDRYLCVFFFSSIPSSLSDSGLHQTVRCGFLSYCCKFI